MVVSLKQFRDRYPEAKLTSDLLIVQGNQFVVKVTIQTQAGGIATGMAADAQIEVAEDRARQRALQGLGDLAAEAAPNSPATPQLTTPDVDHSDTTTQKTVHTIDRDIELIDSQNPLVAASLPSQTVAAELETTVSAPELAATALVSPSANEAVPRPSATASQPKLVDHSSNNQPKSQANQLEQPLETSIVEIPPINNLASPVNLSDVIAQTGVELRRLGWSVADGREYLEEAYGKRSRHDLTDEELIAFLMHLESLES